MSVSKADLKFYLTGAEALTTQTVTAQSIGGYPSQTIVNPSALLSTLMDLNDTDFSTTTALSPFPYAVGMLDEIVKTSGTTVGLNLTGTRGAFDTDVRYHSVGDIVYNIQKGFFNNSLVSGKQYRCIAVTNTGTGTFNDLQFYFKFSSLNPNSFFRLAVEIPETELVVGTATGGSSISLVDSSKKGDFTDELDDCVLTITSGVYIGVGRTIASFDTATGTFTFRKAFPVIGDTTGIAVGTTYRVENAPSQRTISGTVAPEGLTFDTAPNLRGAISIDDDNRTNGPDLAPNETVYVWIERNILTNNTVFPDNRMILTAAYTT